MKKAQFPIKLPLTSLSGQNGFKLDGENTGDYSGSAISTAGDVNGDGHIDLIIGAYGYPGGLNKGRSYVVFGGSGVGNNADISLSSLNGINGFKLDGENDNDLCGNSVGASDINGDGYADIVIGAPGYPGGMSKGRSYVVFGKPGIGGGGVFNLSSLTGANGFKINGENDNDYSGSPVGGAGDVNGDGYADLVIGASGYNSNEGRGYVVFGGPGVGSGGVFNLSSLTGTNGYKLNGEVPSDFGGDIHGSGDVNGDGYADILIGASNYPVGGPGRSYVFFGRSTTISGGVYNLSNLDSSNGFKLDGEKVGGGHSGFPHIAGDVNGDGFDDIIIEDGYYGGLGGARAYIVFGGATVGMRWNSASTLSSLNGSNGFIITGLAAYGSSVNSAGDINKDGYDDVIIGMGYPEGTSCIVLGGSQIVTNGIMALSEFNGTNGFQLGGETGGNGGGGPAPAVSTLGDINGDGVDDFAIGAHNYNGGGGTGRSYVIFGDSYSPQLVNNHLTISQNQTLVITSQVLSATDLHQPAASLWFNISNIQHGYFETTYAPGSAITIFNQSQIENNQIEFVQDGSLLAPSYNVEVHHIGIAISPTQTAAITFSPNFPTAAPSPPAQNNNGFSLEKTIITAVVSGAIGLLFACLQACLKRAANNKLTQALGAGSDPFDLNVVRPVAKEIAHRVKITGFMNYTTNTEMIEYKGAVRNLLTELDSRGVDLHLTEMSDAKRDGLINEIATQAKSQLVSKGCCTSLVSFFKAQATPESIREAAPKIADKVTEVLSQRQQSIALT